MRPAYSLLLALAFACGLATPVLAERDRLYTAPDPASTGGIRGEIARPQLNPVQVLAVACDDPELVYVAQLSGRSFEITGLPMRKYDLIVIFNDRFHEGFTLATGEDTLTAEDRQKIKATIDKSEPYFTVKTIHRAQGTTGRGSLCRCVVTYLRDRGSTNGNQFRRTFKLVVMKDVGPGWQVLRARDLYPTWTSPQQAHPEHHFDPQLGQIRVTDKVKDLGELRLDE